MVPETAQREKPNKAELELPEGLRDELRARGIATSISSHRFARCSTDTAIG